MTLTCAVRAIVVGLLSVIALRLLLRRKRGVPAAAVRAGGPKFRIASLLWHRRKSGALITRIGAGSPAEKAGLKTGDVVIRFAGQRVRNAGQLRKLVEAANEGTDAQIEVLRDGSEKCLLVTLAKSPLMSAPVEPSSDRQC